MDDAFFRDGRREGNRLLLKPEEGEKDDFATVAEVARRLGISERQVYRYVRRVTDTDKQKSVTGQTLYRVDAISKQRGTTDTLTPSDTDTDTDAKPDVTDTAFDIETSVSDASTDAVMTPDVSVSDASKDVLIEQLRERLEEKAEEVDFLRDALKRSQEVEKALTTELTEVRRRSDILLAGSMRLLPTGEPPGEYVPTASQDAPTATEGTGGDKVPGDAGETMPARETEKAEGEESRPEEPRRWWQFWKKGNG